MSHVLSKREEKALLALETECDFRPDTFIAKGRLPTGIGETTLDTLESLGLVESGPSEMGHGKGYKITEDGERCLWGMSKEEIRNLSDGKTVVEPKPRRWPI